MNLILLQDSGMTIQVQFFDLQTLYIDSKEISGDKS